VFFLDVAKEVAIIKFSLFYFSKPLLFLPTLRRAGVFLLSHPENYGLLFFYEIKGIGSEIQV